MYSTASAPDRGHTDMLMKTFRSSLFKTVNEHDAKLESNFMSLLLLILKF